MAKIDSSANKVNCFLCRYFYITHEQNFPYGCRAIGFKSKYLPSFAVYSNSGLECQSFVVKQEKGSNQ